MRPVHVQRMVGASDDDLKLLIAKRFVIPFETGIIVIKHWKIHNYIRKDRLKETVYQTEKALLSEKENGSYTLCPSTVSQLTDECQHRLDKVRLDKVRLDKVRLEKDIPYSKIIEHLNSKAGTAYKHTSQKTKDLIQARFNENFTLQDFTTVIDKKVIEWTNTEFQKYIRPETLFSNKFEGYLNQKSTSPQKGSSNPFMDKVKEMQNEQD